MATRTDYNEIAVKAARSVLLELAHLLGENREDMVLVGRVGSQNPGIEAVQS